MPPLEMRDYYSSLRGQWGDPLLRHCPFRCQHFTPENALTGGDALELQPDDAFPASIPVDPPGHTAAPAKPPNKRTMETPGKAEGIGTWHRYKLGQAQFTSWLKKTAEKSTSTKPTEQAPDSETNENNQNGTQQPRRKRKPKTKSNSQAANARIDFDPKNAKFVHWS